MMAKLRVALADLSHINATNAHNLYVPLNVGFIAAYCKVRFRQDIEVELFKDPMQLIEESALKPFDVVGLGAYYWKNELNKYVASKLKDFDRNTAIVVGGPCIDSDPTTQERYMLMHPNYDAIIPNEGEVAFGNFVEMMLGDGPNEYDAIAGVVARNIDGGLVRGSFINLSTDLSQIPSPYLDGTLDQFLDGQWQPLLQTSRLCPYTCAFCVSGKDRGKLRAFPLEQVREEVDYVARRFRGDRNTITYICDENFGILARDLDVAGYIVDSRRRRGYPNRVFYYNDKRFTHISRKLHERLGGMCYHGVCLSLQSENPEALKAIHRRNLTDEQVASALAWAKGLGLKTSTELIFGLPGETLQSYCATVDKCARAGFDSVNSYNLIMFDGIEMDRPYYRAEHGIRGAFRPIHGSATVFTDRVVVEREEVVLEAKGFDLQDFMAVRRINVLLKAVYALELERPFFKGLIDSGMSLSAFLLLFSTMNEAQRLRYEPNDFITHAHIRFCIQLQFVVCSNLYDEESWHYRDQLVQAGKVEPHANSNAFLPREAYDGGWFLPALERTRRKLEERHVENRPPDRGQGTERALQPGAGGRGVGAQ